MLWSTTAIAMVVAVMSVAGLFWPATYARETAYSRTGGYASDVVDLVLVVPILLISGIKAYRGSISARFVWLGTQGYLLYNLVIYAFGVKFNPLFLVYVATLSLSFFATVFTVLFIPLEQVAEAYGSRAPRKTIAIVFLALALQTAVFELREDVAAILVGQVPRSVTQATTPVNFIHVLDLGFLLPGLCVSASLLFCRKASAYPLAPALLTLLAIMSMELVSIWPVMGRAGFGMSIPMIIFFIVLGVGFTVLLSFYLPLARSGSWVALRSPDYTSQHVQRSLVSR